MNCEIVSFIENIPQLNRQGDSMIQALNYFEAFTAKKSNLHETIERKRGVELGSH